MPRLRDDEKQAKLGALKKMKGKWFGLFGPSGEGKKGIDPDAKPPSNEFGQCVNRDGSMCKLPPPPLPPKKDDEDDDKE